MATLDPRLLAQILAGGKSEYFQDGLAYTPIYGSGSYSGADNYTPGDLQEIRGYNFTPGPGKVNTDLNGTPYDVFNTQGEQTGSGTWSDLGDHKGLAKYGMFLPILMAGGVAGLQALGMMGGVNPVLAEMGLGGGGMGGAGIGGAAAGGAELTSSMGALESGLAPAANGGWTVAGPGTAGVGATTAAGGSGGSSLLGKIGGALSGSGVSSLLGPAAALIGAAAGSQGQEQTSSQQRRMDPRMDPYYFGDNGLLALTQRLMQEQSGPAYADAARQMRDGGMALLRQPVAGNGFALLRG